MQASEARRGGGGGGWGGTQHPCTPMREVCAKGVASGSAPFSPAQVFVAFNDRGLRVLRFHRGCRSGNPVQARAFTAPARGAARHARRPWSARCTRRPPPFGRPPPPLTRRSQDANSGRHCSACCHNGHRHWLRGAVRFHQDMSRLREECHITDAAAQNGPGNLCSLCGCASPSNPDPNPDPDPNPNPDQVRPAVPSRSSRSPSAPRARSARRRRGCASSPPPPPPRAPPMPPCSVATSARLASACPRWSPGSRCRGGTARRRAARQRARQRRRRSRRAQR